MKHEINKEKKIVFISTFVLLVLIIGTSFAYYYANFIGTSENEIISGKIQIDLENENGMLLENQKRVTDTVGASISEDDAFTFDVVSTINGEAVLNYDVALEVIELTNVTDEQVKISLLKKYNDNGTAKQEYVLGSASSGVTVKSIENKTSPNNLFTGFVLDNGTVTKTETITYVLRAWVSRTESENEDFLGESHTNNVCSNSTYTTETDCVNAGEVWGSSHTIESTASPSFHFKVNLKAEQVEE